MRFREAAGFEFCSECTELLTGIEGTVLNSVKFERGNRLAKGTEQLKRKNIELWENLLSFAP